MSNVGPSPTLSPDTAPVTSHTSTEQWQSFEFRMRHRRAERCLLRAEIALQAGVEDDARDALDEAERLHSENPKLAELRAVLAERVAATVIARESVHARTSWSWLRVAAAAVIFLLVGTGAYFITRTNAPALETAPTSASTAASEPAAPASLPSLPAPADLSVAAAALADPGTSAPAGTAGQAEPEPSAAPDTPVRVPDRVPDNLSTDRTAPATRPTLPAFNPQFAEPRPVTLPPASSPVETASLRTALPPSAPAPAPVIPETPGAAPAGTLDRMGEKLPASNLPPPERRPAPEKPAATDAPPVAAKTPVPAAPVSPAPPANEEPRVRAVLARYEAAYSGLNASAAQEVWPAVDQRSLARAFDTLQSQQVALGQCSVQVEGTTASASCSGRVTWTPKVGGGSQTAARQWRFQLHSGNGAWQITRAEVR